MQQMQRPWRVIDDAAVIEAWRARLQDLLGANADIDLIQRTIDGNAPDGEKADLWLWAIAPFERATVGRLDERSGA